MSNKMNKILLIVVLICLSASAYGFAPQRRDFDSEYQYRLYRSWLAKESTEIDLPAKITAEYVRRNIKFSKTGEAQVIYIWKNWKIVSQREDLPAMMSFSNYETELIIAGELLYRLNSRHRRFAEDYLDKLPISITYQGLRSSFAIDSLYAHYPDQRLPLEKLHPVIDNDKLAQLILQLANGDELIIIFNELSQYPTARLQLEKWENTIAAEELPNEFSRHQEDIATLYEPLKEQEKPEEIISFQEPADTTDKEITIDISSDTLLTDYEVKLLNWIETNLDTAWGSEMLNNKIPNITEFLQTEFSQHSLLIKGDKYILFHEPFSGNLKSNLYLRINNSEGWSIDALDDINIINKKVTFAGFEEFDLSSLENYDIQVIAPYIPQLLMTHRVMASRLAGFILEPDIAETTLVVRGSSRHVYDLDSYRDLLFILGKFWQDRTIYYNIADFRLIDGYIEFKGYLAAEDSDTGQYDLAEIRYRLDDDYTIVLAMVVVFPDQASQYEQGR
ncbi:MAG: hypothetical protein P9X26_08615 [Candidatus Stygibacter frigidus]|nr:hypothetical protein [Candidatus Stygibacter frigidus]